MRRLLCGLVAVLITAGCAAQAAPNPGAVFDNEGGAEITCLRHQSQPPGARYTDPAMKRTGEVLPLLRYYTVNGRKAYCDGAGPSDLDKGWARLYVQLGAEGANVAGLLG